ncbi:uncharacterized protein LOC134826211 isoform X1 [Bolinopsis microptera]|uniref:uncharacterized protein LOC134826211 isoform X1 n=1 Tax=Bolinopsis microptera TaxID=2820187 RepID=UPI00307A56D5
MAPRIRVPANFGKEHINSEAHGNLLLKLKDGQGIKTNSMIMSLNSPVIDNLTTNLFQSSLEMDDFTKEAVECFVESMYTGEVDLLKKLIFEDVNKMAHVFDVSWLAKRCLKFYKTVVLNFRSNSYEEILFACEVASRAHCNLKQSNYVSSFVKNMVSRNIGRTLFLQRYMAGFAELSKRQIDMSVAIAGNFSKSVMMPFISHVINNLDCKKLDENSLYLLEQLDVQKLRQDFPMYFNDAANLLAEVAEISESSEVNDLVKKFLETKSDIAASSSKDDDTEDSETTEECDIDDSDCEEVANVAIQTEDVKYASSSKDDDTEDNETTEECDIDESDCEEVANVAIQTEEVEYDWIKPKLNVWHSGVLLNESVQFITADNKISGSFNIRYTLHGEGRTDKKQLGMRCENVDTSQWSIFIESGTVHDWNKRFLHEVPHDNLKHWIITKSSSHLKVVCNKVTVLHFNFSTDCDSDKRDGERFWSRKANEAEFYCHLNNSILLRTLDS